MIYHPPFLIANCLVSHTWIYLPVDVRVGSLRLFFGMSVSDSPVQVYPVQLVIDLEDVGGS